MLVFLTLSIKNWVFWPTSSFPFLCVSISSEWDSNKVYFEQSTNIPNIIWVNYFNYYLWVTLKIISHLTMLVIIQNHRSVPWTFLYPFPILIKFFATIVICSLYSTIILKSIFHAKLKRTKGNDSCIERLLSSLALSKIRFSQRNNSLFAFEAKLPSLRSS